MSRTIRRIAPSHLAMLTAAGLFASPALAATTTVSVPANTTQTTAVTASPAAGDTVIVDVDGTLRGSSATSYNTIVIQGSGAGSVIIDNDGLIQGRFNFPSATGPITLNNNTGNPTTAGWHTSSTTIFGSGNDAINNGEDGVIATQAATTFAFGTGTDSFTNDGRLIVDRVGTASVTLSMTGLETFNNTGTIVLGSVYNVAGATGEATDGATNDRLQALGAAFTGSEGSRIMMDVTLGGTSQLTCFASVADCVDFTGGSTAGSTLLTLNQAGFGVPALGTVITLVAGSSDAGHFTLDTASEGYVQASFGGAVQNGPFAYRLVYNDTANAHQLVGVLSDEAVQASVAPAIAQDTWRATAGTWFSRQADLRATPEGLESSNGLWARIGAAVAERDSSQTIDAGGLSGVYVLDYQQRTSQLVFGADVLRASTQDTAWVLGGMIGYARSDVDFDYAGSEAIYAGVTGGLYGSYVAGPLFVDGLFNVNLLDAKTDVPAMTLGTEVKLTNRIKSLGGQVEAGWKFALTPNLSLEPLVGAAYVESQFEDVEVPDTSVLLDYDDSYKSLRIGAGARLALESELAGMKAAYALTARYWDEQEAENASAITVGAGSTAMLDAFAGDFSELTGSVNLFSGAVSGFAELGVRIGDDYEAANGALGVRVRW